jgi:hypothetical protein
MLNIFETESKTNNESKIQAQNFQTEKKFSYKKRKLWFHFKNKQLRKYILLFHKERSNSGGTAHSVVQLDINFINVNT